MSDDLHYAREAIASSRRAIDRADECRRQSERLTGYRVKVRAGLFWQAEEARPGDLFEHRGNEYEVDNVVASPSGGYEVCAHPTMAFRVDAAGERVE